jgi:hypothetical protein
MVGWTGLPPRFARPISWLSGLPDPCKADADCKKVPCEVCSPTGEETPEGHIGLCVSRCAGCEICQNHQCVSNCPEKCQRCNKYADNQGACGPDPDHQRHCKSCDPKTGEKDLCTACEKCDRGACLQNCPGRCETCDAGKCRKCEGPCEVCDPTGKCFGCDPRCERCNPATETCESTCPGGFSCCYGECSSCCSDCGRKREERQCEYREDTCPEYRHLGTTTVCCGKQCADLLTDLEHCGRCDNKCRGSVGPAPTEETCSDGKCICSQRMIDPKILALSQPVECRQEGHECCYGECVEIAKYQSDPKHCGKCIVECEEAERCVKGQCVGRKRRGYSLLVVHTVTSAKLGVERSVTMKADVRELDTPDAEGNTFAGKGSYQGFARRYNPSCDNDQRTAYSTIPLGGKAKGTATADDLGGGQIALVFTITPLKPPENLPEGVLPALGNLVLTGGLGQESRTFEMQSDLCRGTLTHVNEWSATRIK